MEDVAQSDQQKLEELHVTVIATHVTALQPHHSLLAHTCLHLEDLSSQKGLSPVVGHLPFFTQQLETYQCLSSTLPAY